jgi:putative IMPACT (imprinted ancient) family translation regulator
MEIVPAPLFELAHRHCDHELILRDAIEDRGSRYTISAFPFSDLEQLAWYQARFDPTATHNSYAWRILRDDGSIRQDSNDDGETGAGVCILRELLRSDMVNILLVVTRYFGGVKLETDRYKHIVDGCRMVLEKL